jgi:hypothetical protein
MINESRPRNENTVTSAMKPPDNLGVDTAFVTGDGDDVGWDTCEFECDCIFVDVADVS